MKLTIFLLLVAVLQVLAGETYSQNTKLTLNLGETNVEQVLKEIEGHSDFYFLFNQKLVDVNRKVNLQVTDKNIDEILAQVFKNTDVEYMVIDRQIVLSPREFLVEAKFKLQPLVINGTITDESGEPLPGVYVVIQGTTSGTMTDADGSYSINVTGPDDILEYSFVGMLDQEIQVGNQTRIDVTMQMAVSELEDIVVVGYGTQTKRNVTGSIQTVQADELTEIPVAQVTQSLAGKLSGVQINQISGVPGKDMQIRVRGQGSISAGSDPLYVVDGFPITGNMSDINAEEIESITILKDAASTSMYGSRAANGVILIQTKQAQAGQTNINLSTYYGIQRVPDKGRPELMDGQTFAQWQKEIYTARGLEVPEAFQNPSIYGEGTNWFDLFFDTAPVQDYSLSISTGTERFKTSAVLGYYNQEGTIINSGYERYSFRLNSSFQLLDGVNLGLNLAPTITSRYEPGDRADGWSFGGGLIGSALVAWPIFDYENEDGSLPVNCTVPGFERPNYYRSAQEIKNETEETRLLSNVYLEIEPIEGLLLRSSANLQLNNENEMLFMPTTASTDFGRSLPNINELTRKTTNALSWLWENTVTYSKIFGDHNLTILAGYTAQKNHNYFQSLYARNFPDDRIYDIDTATEILQGSVRRGGSGNETQSDEEEWALLSYLGRMNYDYQGKYLLQLAIRRDGSSRFGPDNRWGSFPSVSAGWIISDENFFPQTDWLSLLKLRGSWGITGNNNIGNYTHQALIALDDITFHGDEIVAGSHVSNLINTELGWETTKQWDAGVDLSLVRNRINVTYDFYSKRTTNLLYDFNIPTSTGFSDFTGNSGELKFWGHEISVLTRNFVGEFNWNTNFNISFNENEVISLTRGVDYFITGGHMVMVGEPIGVMWGLTQDGLYWDQDDFDNSPKSSRSVVGGIKFKDINGDGQIVMEDTKPGGDYSIIGDPNPIFLFGMTNSLSYKNFDLSVTMSGSYGNDIASRFHSLSTNLDGTFNVLAECFNYWRSPEDPGDGKYGTVRTATELERDYFHTRSVFDGSYLTIKNITLGYSFDASKINFLKNARIYCSLQQVYTFTKYPGNNPEISNTGEGEATSTLTMGDDYSSVPVPRTYTLGINVSF